MGEVLLLSRGLRVLRGSKAEDERRDRLRWIRRAAYNRAIHGGYHEADEAMFGPDLQLLRDGPDWPEPANERTGSSAA